MMYLEAGFSIQTLTNRHFRGHFRALMSTVRILRDLKSVVLSTSLVRICNIDHVHVSQEIRFHSVSEEHRRGPTAIKHTGRVFGLVSTCN